MWHVLTGTFYEFLANSDSHSMSQRTVYGFPHFAAIGPSHCLHWNAFRYPPEPSILYAYLPAAFPRMFVVRLSHHPLYGINSGLIYFLLQLAATLFASVWVNCEDDKIHQNTLRFTDGQSSSANSVTQASDHWEGAGCDSDISIRWAIWVVCFRYLGTRGPGKPFG